MPSNRDYMRSFRRATQRAATAAVAIASVLLLATCDLDKITGTPKPLTQAEIDRIFSIVGDSTVILAGTSDLVISSEADLTHTTQRWTSSNPALAAVDSTSGVVTGVALGVATITARLLAPELDTGYTKQHVVRVRYKGIKVAAIDSIPGLQLSRPIVVNGTNNLDAIVSPAITNAALSTHDSGSTASTITSISGQSVVGRKPGRAYVIAAFETFKDSVLMKMRQVAKRIVFPATEYIIDAVSATPNVAANRTLPLTVKDVNDSVIVSPVFRWRSADTNQVTIDSITGAMRAKTVTAQTTVTVRVDTVSRPQTVRVVQAVASLTKTAGDAQTNTVAQVVPIAPQVKAVDAGNTAVAGATVTFKVGSGGGVIADSVKITDADGLATIGSWTLGNLAGANTVIATSGNVTATFTATAVPGVPTKLAFSVQPPPVSLGSTINPAVKVVIQDEHGNTVTSATQSVTLTIGNNPGTATLGGTVTVAAVEGVATFSDLTLSAGGSGYTFEATAGTLTKAISNGFDAFGAAAKLGWATHPANTSVGAVMLPVRVTVQDAQGNVVGNSTQTITLAIANNPGSATLGGTLSVAAVNGAAVFSDLTMSAAGNGYTLQATGGTLTAATSTAFNVAPVGAAAKLAFSVQPSNVAAGASITPAIKVQVQDAAGALVATSTQQIALSIGTNPSSGSLSGTVTQNAVNGEATFNNISINNVGAGYTLTAGAPGTTLTGATSTTFNVTPGVATKLGFVLQPTHVPSGQTITPAVTVAVQDANGNTVTTHPQTSVALTLSGCSSTLGGSTSANTAAGVASFSNLTVATAASGCLLNAAATGLTGATSSSFNSVAAGGAVKLGFTTEPTGTNAGNFMSSFTVAIQDVNGNNVSASPSAPITITVFSGPGSIVGGTTTRSTTTTATFTSLVIEKAGTYRFLASSPSFRSDTSATFTISAGFADRLGFLTQPTTTVAGNPITPDVQVAVQDQYGNTVTSSTTAIDLFANANTQSIQFADGAFSKRQNAVNGVATFSNLTINKAAKDVELSASTPFTFLFSASSNKFDIQAGPLSTLGFAQQPPSSVNAGAVLSPALQVQAQDAAGNAIADFTSPISVALTGGATGAVLNGTKTVTPTAGVATFNDLSVDKPGTAYRLNASASGLTTIASNSFDVTIGSASKLVFTTQPTNITGGGTFNVTVAITDPAGNVVTNDNRTITLGILSGTGTPGAVLSGSTSQFSSNGVATFNNVSVNKVGTGYKLQATVFFGDLTAATSNAFDVTLGTKAKLTFTDQPSNTNGGATITPAVTVAITDQGGNVVTTATDQVTIAITQFTGSSSATLSGTKTVAAVNGVATFSDLSIDKAASFYRLTATATGLAAAESNNFNVIVGPKAKLVISGQPTSVSSGFTFTVQADVADAGGNIITSATDVVAIDIKSGTGVSGAVLGGTKTVTASSGRATFNTLTLDKAGSGYQLTATSGTLTAATTNSFTVNPGSATKLAWITQPTATFVNAPLVPSGQLPQIAVQDAAGNTVTSNTSTVRIAIAVGPTSTFKSLGSNVTSRDINAVSGIATIPSTVTMGTAGTFTLQASSPFSGYTSANSSSFTVAAFDAKTKLGFVGEPSNATYAVSISPAVTVAIQDQYGNTVTSATDAVTLTLDTDANPTTTLSGGSATAAVSGLAIFSAVSLNRTGTGYKLGASASGLTADTSASFNVTSPGVLLSNVFTYDMARVGNTIYVVDGSDLKSVPATGGSATTLTASANSYRVTTDGTNVYWLEGTTGTTALKKYTVSTGAISTLASGMTDAQLQASVLATDGTNVYFVARNAPGTALAIRSVSVNANNATPTDLFSTNSTSQVPYFMVSGGLIYFNDPALSKVRRMTTSGTPITNLADSESAYLFALSGTTLYFTPSANNTIIKSIANANSISGPVTPTTQVSGSTFIYNWALDGSNLYANFAGEIRRYSLSSFASFTSMATSVSQWYFNIPIDSESFYYNDGSSRIAKLPK